MKRFLLTLAMFSATGAHAQLVADFSASATVLDCNTPCVDFTDLTSGGTPTSWQWSFPGAVPSTSTAQNPTNICYANDGTYDVRLIVSDGTDTDTLEQTAYIFKQAVPGAFVFPVDTTIQFGAMLTLTAGGGVTYSWFPVTGLVDPTAPSTLAAVINTTVYSVTITDASGCSTTLSVTVNLDKENNLYVPTAFSPNGDGYNETLYLRGNNLTTVQFVVFDRWGTKVFETTDARRGWDGNYNGERAAAGVYTYVAVITYGDGSSQKLAGQTSLIR